MRGWTPKIKFSIERITPAALPVFLIFIITLCIVILFATLIFSVSIQLGSMRFEPLTLMLIAIFGGAGPITNAYSIANNKPWSKWSTIVNLLGGNTLLIYLMDTRLIPKPDILYFSPLLLLLSCTLILPFFFNKKVQAYYSSIASKPTTQQLRTNINKHSPKPWKLDEIIALLIEVAIVAISIGIFSVIFIN